MDAGLSWQLFDPWPIVRRLKVPVCYDLRQADLIAGGQGAPITPMADWVLFRHRDKSRLIVNLGGICNVTHLPKGAGVQDIRGGDIGPCNIIIDGVVRELFPGHEYDVDGRLAAAGVGTPGNALWGAVKSHPFFTRPWPASTGREDFTQAWVARLCSGLSDKHHPADLLHDAMETVAAVLGEFARRRQCDQVILAGGGAKNPALLAHIESMGGPIESFTLAGLGVPVDAREALEFAILGALSQDGVPITLPQVTGAKEPGRAGAWVYP